MRERDCGKTGDGDGRRSGMERVHAVFHHPLYRKCYCRLEELEQDRKFCRHQMPHLLDVARIAYILDLEQGAGIPRDVVYAAAILHDIGKYAQYEDGTPHELAGRDIAAEILESLPKDRRFSPEEQEMILTAVQGHRRQREGAQVLERLLYRADKASRMCFSCPAEQECDWSAEQKNMEPEI